MSRIVLVTETASGGIGKHVLDLAEGFADRGHDVLLVYSPTRAGESFRDRLARHRAVGYQAVSVPMQRSPSVRDLSALRILRRELYKFGRVDVLHGHSSKAGALTRLARFGIARSVVYTPNAFYTLNPALRPYSRRLYGATEALLALASERIIACSEDEHRHALDLGISPARMALVENGIDIWSDDRVAAARRAARDRLGISQDEVLVGVVGRMVPQKDPELAVRVLARVHRSCGSARLVMAGDGPEHAKAKQLAKKLTVGESIIWPGEVDGQETICALDVLLVTSRYEGFPYSILEALNAGAAVVTTRVGGASACVKEGQNGFIVPLDDERAAASAVSRLLGDSSLLEAMKRASRQSVNEFSVQRMVDRTLAVYTEALDHRSK